MTHCKYIDDYIDGVRDGSIITGKNIKKAMDYVERTLEEPGIIIDDAKIERGIQLIEKYFKIKFLDWELFIFALIHCYYKDDTVVFDEFLIMMGRGNGKNGFISPLIWYLTLPEHGVDEYNIDIIANSEDQAKVSFDDVYAVLDKNWFKMKNHFYKSKQLIENTKTDSYIKFNTSNARTKDGKRSACLVFDEIHEYEDYKIISVFTSAFGKKAHSRAFYITTQGYIREGVLDDKLRVAHDVLNGESEGYGLLPLLYEIDKEEDAKNLDYWHKANPSLKYFPLLKREMKKDYRVMERQPHVKQEFYTKRLNFPTANKAIAVTDIKNLMATNKPLPDMTGWACTCGIDFASVSDMVSVNLHFQRDGESYDINHSWLCSNSCDFARIKPNKAEWVERGELTIVDDVEVSPFIVADWINDKMKIYDITGVALDNYRYALMRKALTDIGFTHERKNLTRVRPSDIYQIVPVVESRFNNNRFTWGDNKLLRWATNNVAVKTKPGQDGIDTGNRYYVKIEARSRKTDPFMALVHSMIIEEVVERYAAVPDFGVYVF